MFRSEALDDPPFYDLAMPHRKTPDEKKQLSYERDGRNVYGENDKAARKNIPRSRQRASQTYRTTTKQLLDQVVSGADADEAEAQVRAVRGTGTGISTAWRKQRDRPLGEWLDRRRRRAEQKAAQSDEHVDPAA